MTPFDRLVIEKLDALPGEGAWDVMPEFCRPRPSICGEYPTAGAAASALEAAGYNPTKAAVATPPLAAFYDLQTVLKFEDAEGRKVLLARRRDPNVGS